MKKSFLPLAVVLLLLPQSSISQDSMDIQNDFPLSVEEKVEVIDELTPKGKSKIQTLKTFELLDESASSMKVVATFIQKEFFELRVYNEKGLSVYKENFETKELNLAMGFANLPNGDYFISLKTRDGEIVKPLK